MTLRISTSSQHAIYEVEFYFRDRIVIPNLAETGVQPYEKSNLHKLVPGNKTKG